MKKKPTAAQLTGKSNVAIRNLLNNLKENELHYENKQITQCVFLGVLRLKPVPTVFSNVPSTSTNVTRNKPRQAKLINNNKNTEINKNPSKTANNKVINGKVIKKNSEKVKACVKKNQDKKSVRDKLNMNQDRDRADLSKSIRGSSEIPDNLTFNPVDSLFNKIKQHRIEDETSTSLDCLITNKSLKTPSSLLTPSRCLTNTSKSKKKSSPLGSNISDKDDVIFVSQSSPNISSSEDSFEDIVVIDSPQSDRNVPIISNTPLEVIVIDEPISSNTIATTDYNRETLRISPRAKRYHDTGKNCQSNMIATTETINLTTEDSAEESKQSSTLLMPVNKMKNISNDKPRPRRSRLMPAIPDIFLNSRMLLRSEFSQKKEVSVDKTKNREKRTPRSSIDNTLSHISHTINQGRKESTNEKTTTDTWAITSPIQNNRDAQLVSEKPLTLKLTLTKTSKSSPKNQETQTDGPMYEPNQLSSPDSDSLNNNTSIARSTFSKKSLSSNERTAQKKNQLQVIVIDDDEDPIRKNICANPLQQSSSSLITCSNIEKLKTKVPSEVPSEKTRVPYEKRVEKSISHKALLSTSSKSMLSNVRHEKKINIPTATIILEDEIPPANDLTTLLKPTESTAVSITLSKSPENPPVSPRLLRSSNSPKKVEAAKDDIKIPSGNSPTETVPDARGIPLEVNFASEQKTRTLRSSSSSPKSNSPEKNHDITQRSCSSSPKSISNEKNDDISPGLVQIDLVEGSKNAKKNVPVLDKIIPKNKIEQPVSTPSQISVDEKQDNNNIDKILLPTFDVIPEKLIDEHRSEFIQIQPQKKEAVPKTNNINTVMENNVQAEKLEKDVTTQKEKLLLDNLVLPAAEGCQVQEVSETAAEKVTEIFTSTEPSLCSSFSNSETKIPITKNKRKTTSTSNNRKYLIPKSKNINFDEISVVNERRGRKIREPNSRLLRSNLQNLKKNNENEVETKVVVLIHEEPKKSLPSPNSASDGETPNASNKISSSDMVVQRQLRSADPTSNVEIISKIEENSSTHSAVANNEDIENKLDEAHTSSDVSVKSKSTKTKLMKTDSRIVANTTSVSPISKIESNSRTLRSQNGQTHTTDMAPRSSPEEKQSDPVQLVSLPEDHKENTLKPKRTVKRRITSSAKRLNDIKIKVAASKVRNAKIAAIRKLKKNVVTKADIVKKTKTEVAAKVDKTKKTNKALSVKPVKKLKGKSQDLLVKVEGKSSNKVDVKKKMEHVKKLKPSVIKKKDVKKQLDNKLNKKINKPKMNSTLLKRRAALTKSEQPKKTKPSSQNSVSDILNVPVEEKQVKPTEKQVSSLIDVEKLNVKDSARRGKYEKRGAKSTIANVNSTKKKVVASQRKSLRSIAKPLSPNNDAARKSNDITVFDFDETELDSSPINVPYGLKQEKLLNESKSENESLRSTDLNVSMHAVESQSSTQVKLGSSKKNNNSNAVRKPRNDNNSMIDKQKTKDAKLEVPGPETTCKVHEDVAEDVICSPRGSMASLHSSEALESNVRIEKSSENVHNQKKTTYENNTGSKIVKEKLYSVIQKDSEKPTKRKMYSRIEKPKEPVGSMDSKYDNVSNVQMKSEDSPKTPAPAQLEEHASNTPSPKKSPMKQTTIIDMFTKMRQKNQQAPLKNLFAKPEARTENIAKGPPKDKQLIQEGRNDNDKIEKGRKRIKHFDELERSKEQSGRQRREVHEPNADISTFERRRSVQRDDKKAPKVPIGQKKELQEENVDITTFEKRKSVQRSSKIPVDPSKELQEPNGDISTTERRRSRSAQRDDRKALKVPAGQRKTLREQDADISTMEKRRSVHREDRRATKVPRRECSVQRREGEQKDNEQPQQTHNEQAERKEIIQSTKNEQPNCVTDGTLSPPMSDLEEDDDSDCESRMEWIPEEYAEYMFKYTAKKMTNNCKPSYKCKICLLFFPTYYMLKKHKVKHTEVDKPYKCQECDEAFSDVVDLTAHLRVHKGKHAYTCRKCGEGFWSKNALDAHKPRHILSKLKPPEKKFRCDVCAKEFSKLCDVERHTRVHTGEKPCVCNICNRRFQQAHNLSKHLLIHLGIKQFTCEICNKQFGRADILDRHILTHSVDKPFKCQHCTKGFIRQSQLTHHLQKLHANAEAKNAKAASVAASGK